MNRGGSSLRFVVDKSRLHRTIDIVWSDWLATYRGVGPLHLRLKADADGLTIDGKGINATIPAKVEEPGVMFISATLFDELVYQSVDLPSGKLTVDCDGYSLRINGINRDVEPEELQLFDDPDEAPSEWPGVADNEDEEVTDTGIEQAPAASASPPQQMIISKTSSDSDVRHQLAWAVDIVRKQFSAGLDEICNPHFLKRRYKEFEFKNDPIYAELLKGMQDEALSKTFVSYWTIAHTMATKSRFWLEDAVAEIIIHQAQKLGRKATHVYSHSMLAAGYFDEMRTIEQLGEDYREQLTDRSPWRPLVQTKALEKVDVIVGRQERERKLGHDSKRSVQRDWEDQKNQQLAAKDQKCLAEVAAVLTATTGDEPVERVAGVSEVTMQCNLLVVEPDKLGGKPHVWAFRFVNPKTVANHASRKQERVNLLRLYALLVQEKPLRSWDSIHVSLAELLPRHVDFADLDRYPDYFSAITYWSSDRLWEFIGVPFRVVTLAIQDVAKEFRERLKDGLRDLLPDAKTRTT